MEDIFIQGWFFILSKQKNPTLNPNLLDYEMQAIFGRTQDIQDDTNEILGNTLIKLKIQKNLHRKIVKDLHIASNVFITGKVQTCNHSKFIQVEKIYTKLNHEDIAQF
ncbi:MAG: hypothetical protein VX112_00145 [Pseudomonadota bacterium]|nr:hypothetical protein [Pseudomonadota bacterium]